MRVPVGRSSAVIVAILATTLLLSMAGPATLAAKQPPGLSRFMAAMGHVESGGRYTARNRHTGAYGKYQILPSNWPNWAARYLGDRRAKPTAANQEKLAAAKLTVMYRAVGSWRRVAYWWLTGSKRATGWSSAARHYVNRVMRLYAKGGEHRGPGATAAQRHFGESSAAIRYEGSWKTARHGGYAGGKVRYATSRSAAATFTFSGRKVTWYAPAGPTRGKANIYVDGTYVKTVDFHAGGFRARTVAFRTSWKTSREHTIRIEVVGGRHPMVAIDEFVVAR